MYIELLDTKDFTNNLMVIEMMLHTIYLLVVLMSLTSHKDYVTLLCHHGCGANCLLTISNREYLLALCCVESSKHIVDNSLWFFVAWVVTCKDNSVALFNSFLCH